MQDPTPRSPLIAAAAAAASLSDGAGIADAAAGPEGWNPGPSVMDRRIPTGYTEVDPRTARRVPLTLSLRPGVPSYPGDPVFTVNPAAVDTRTSAGGGYLVEDVTGLGTHTASHISAPAHFLIGGHTLADLGEEFTLMPLAVIDVRDRIEQSGAGFRVGSEDLQQWERRHGPIPARGCVLLLTGSAALFDEPGGHDSPYVTTAVPGFDGAAVDWLFTHRRILAIGADTLGPDATGDAALQATTRALVHGGITVENVGPGLALMRPHGDWIGINGNRPAFSGFQMGFTGYTL